MARVIPIDIIKGISGKYGKDADFYFATNTSSGKIRISRLPKPSHRPPSEKQKQQRSRFAARHAAVTAWLNANKPSELNGPKGTVAYQHVQRLKRQLGLSLINQVLLKYMDGDNVIKIHETKEQRRRKPQKPRKSWKRISIGNTKAFHREKISYCPKSNIKSDFEAARLRDAVAERSRSTAFPRPRCPVFNMYTNFGRLLIGREQSYHILITTGSLVNKLMVATPSFR